MCTSATGTEQFASKPDAARAYTTLGLAVIPSHHPEPPRHGSSPYPSGLVCSCGDPDCRTPARHTIGILTLERATTNTGRVAAWWTGMPDANIAMPAGHMCEVLELAYPAPAEHIAVWLGVHQVEPGPILDGGPDLVQFPVRSSEPPSPVGRSRSLPGGGRLDWLVVDTLVLLPPSQTITGHVTSWARPFTTRTALLPDAGALFEALARLPAPAELDAWVRAQGAFHDGRQPSQS